MLLCCRYIDPTGKVQGPFFPADMIEWFKAVRASGSPSSLHGRASNPSAPLPPANYIYAGKAKHSVDPVSVGPGNAQGYLKDMELPTIGHVRSASADAHI